MNWSRFNYLYPSKVFKGKLLYNSLSNSFIEIDNELLSEFIGQLKEGKCEVEEVADTPLYNDFRKYKIVTESDELEVAELKHYALQRRFYPKNLSLTLLPTMNCNFKCPYCFARTANDKVMSVEIENSIDSLIAGYLNNYGTVPVDVTWMGGEPMLCYDTIVSLTQKILKKGVPYTAGIITNGYLLTEERIKRLADLRVHTIQITIDGMKELHNKTRQHKSGKITDTFSVIMNNVETFFDYYKNSKNIRLNIRINLNKKEEYLAKFVDLHRYLRNKFPYQNLSISAGFIDDISVDGFHKSCSFERSAVKDFYTKLYKEYGIDEYSIYPKSKLTECAVRSPHNYIIGASGELYPCWENIGNDTICYGKIDGDGNVQIDNIKEYIKYKAGADYLDDRKCLDCFFFPVCDGGCPEKRILNHFEKTGFDLCCVQKDNIEEILDDHYSYKTRKVQ